MFALDNVTANKFTYYIIQKLKKLKTRTNFLGARSRVGANCAPFRSKKKTSGSKSYQLLSCKQKSALTQIFLRKQATVESLISLVQLNLCEEFKNSHFCKQTHKQNTFASSFLSNQIQKKNFNFLPSKPQGIEAIVLKPLISRRELGCALVSIYFRFSYLIKRCPPLL